MKLLDLVETDFVNYKKTCMTVMFPYCSFKCNMDAGRVVCQNFAFRDSDLADMTVEEIIRRYTSNPMTEAIVMQGFEPFDSFQDLCDLADAFSAVCDDDIVIYTGYREDEISSRIAILRSCVINSKLIIKFGRFIPDSEEIFDEVLGVTLKSKNQYAKVIKEGKI